MLICPETILWHSALAPGHDACSRSGDSRGVPLDRMNPHGCSLVYGHPQGPTGARLIVELLHTLRRRGGGVGLFTGCAAAVNDLWPDPTEPAG